MHRRVLHCLVVAMVALGAGGAGTLPNPATPGSGAVPPPSSSTTSAPPEITPNPSSIHMVGTENGWGDFAGTILRTTDGGRHWRNVGPKTTGTLLPQLGYVLDPQHAWVMQYGGYSGGQWGSATEAEASVFRTVDGGAKWHTAKLPLPGPVSAQYAVQLTFLDAEHGWALAHLRTALHPEQEDQVALFSTANGGATWKLVLGPGQGGLPTAGWKAGITFRTLQNGWLTGRSAGGRQFLYVTHDGGRRWAPITLPLPSAVVHAAHGYTILAPTFWGSDGLLPVCASINDYWPMIDVFRTHDGGATWTGGALVQANTGNACVPTLHPQLGFSGPQHGYFMDDAAYSFVTENGGQTWTQVHPTTRYAQVYGIDFVTPELGWGVVWQGGGNCSSVPAVVQTTDGGKTWQVISPPRAGMPSVPHSCPEVRRSPSGA